MGDFKQDRKRDDNDAPREMFSTVCNDCGDSCEVPFKPTRSKPVYCSKCFEKHDPRADQRPRREERGSRSRGGRREGGPELHSAVCDSCGNNCEVPFKPTGEKPVYCRDCFSGTDTGSRAKGEVHRQSGSTIQGQVGDINKKLDLIIKALKLTVPVADVGSDGDEAGTVTLRQKKTVRAADKVEKISLK